MWHGLKHTLENVCGCCWLCIGEDRTYCDAVIGSMYFTLWCRVANLRKVELAHKKFWILSNGVMLIDAFKSFHLLNAWSLFLTFLVHAWGYKAVLSFVVQQLLEQGTSVQLPNTAATLSDMKSLCLALLEALSDKVLALSHQKKANRWGVICLNCHDPE